MASPSARAELYNRLSEAIGVDSAGTLMSYLPGDEPATKSDIGGLKAYIDASQAEIKADIKAQVSGLAGRVGGLEQRIDGLGERIDGFDKRMDGFERRMGGFERRIDGFDGKLDMFHEALLTQTRHFMLAIVGATASIIAVVVTVG